MKKPNEILETIHDLIVVIPPPKPEKSKGGILLVDDSEERPEIAPYGRILAIGDDVARKMRRVVGSGIDAAEETDEQVRERLIGKIAVFKHEHANLLNFDPVGTKQGVTLVTFVLFTAHMILPSDEAAIALGLAPLPISVERWCELAADPKLRDELPEPELDVELSADQLAEHTLSEIERAGQVT